MMIILDATTKSLKVVLGGAVTTTQLAVTAHYTDITATAYTPGSNDTVTNSTTVVEFVAAPAASTQRHIESISVYNVDTAAATVTIQYVSAGGTRNIAKVVLQSLYALYYEHGAGWQVIDANGSVVSGSNVSDTAYAASWDGVTTVAPSKNAVYDQMELRAPKASPVFTTQITTPVIVATAASLVIKPTTDATTALQLSDKDGNAILNVDTTNGNVGIGTTVPGVKLDVAGGIRTSTDITLYGSTNKILFSNAGGYDFSIQQQSGSYLGFYSPEQSATAKMVIGNTGNVGIGVTNPGSILQIAGILTPEDSGTRDIGTSALLFHEIFAAHNTINTSDERQKQDIVDSDLGLEFINKLLPRSFKFRPHTEETEIVPILDGNSIPVMVQAVDDKGELKFKESVILDANGKKQLIPIMILLTEKKTVLNPDGSIKYMHDHKRTHYGLIAQEVGAVVGDKDFGGYVHDEENDRYGIRESEFVAVLIKAVQELSEKVAKLEAR
jgi:hypothetical protein